LSNRGKLFTLTEWRENGGMLKRIAVFLFADVAE